MRLARSQQAGGSHAETWWRVTETSVDRIKDPSPEDFKGKGKAGLAMARLWSLAEKGQFEDLEKIREAADQILGNVHFRGNWTSWIWNILRFLPFTNYRKIRKTYDQIVRKIHLEHVVLYKALDPSLKAGMKPSPTMQEINSFFADPKHREAFKKVTDLTIVLDRDTDIEIDHLNYFSQLQSLTIKGGDHLTLGPSIQKNRQLTSLVIQGEWTSLHLSASLKKIPTLKTLSLQSLCCDRETTKTLLNLPALEKLELEEVSGLDTTPERMMSSQLKIPDEAPLKKSLRHLKVKNGSFEEEDLSSFFSPRLEVLEIEAMRPFSLQHIEKCTQLKKMVLRVNASSNRDRPIAFPSGIKNLTALEEFSCRGLQFDTFPESLTSLPNLRLLDLRGFSGKDIPSSIHKLSTLEALYLPRDVPNIDTILEGVCGEKLQALDVDISSLKEFPSAITKCSSIKDLVLKIGEGVNLPEDLVQCKSLEELRVFGPLADLPDLSSLSALRHLDCRFSDAIPATLFKCHQLEELDLVLDRKKGVSIPDTISQLRNLKKLSITGNFSEFPPSVLQLTQLKGLALVDYSLEEKEKPLVFPSEIGNLSQLNSLKIFSFSLRGLPDELSRCQALEELELKTPSLKRLPSTLSSLKNLVTVKLSLGTKNRPLHYSGVHETLSTLVNNNERLSVFEYNFIFPEEEKEPEEWEALKKVRQNRKENLGKK